MKSVGTRSHLTTPLLKPHHSYALFTLFLFIRYGGRLEKPKQTTLQSQNMEKVDRFAPLYNRGLFGISFA